MDEVIQKEVYPWITIFNIVAGIFAVLQTVADINYTLDFFNLLYLIVAFSYIISNFTNYTSKQPTIWRCILWLSAVSYIYAYTLEACAVPLFFAYIVRLAVVWRHRQIKYVFVFTMLLFIILSLGFGKFSANMAGYLWIMNLACLMYICGSLLHKIVQLEHKERTQNVVAESRLNQMKSAYQQVASLAERDCLTGLYNYRAFREKIYNLDLSRTAIIMVDIDFFKEFNDKYGHLCGDTVLNEVAKVIEFSVRESDLVFRYGGEEFAVVLRDISKSQLTALADRIRKNVEEHTFFYTGKLLDNITVSVGYALPEGKVVSAEQLFRAADEALYLAKGKGRNAVCCHNELATNIS